MPPSVPCALAGECAAARLQDSAAHSHPALLWRSLSEQRAVAKAEGVQERFLNSSRTPCARLSSITSALSMIV